MIVAQRGAVQLHLEANNRCREPPNVLLNYRPSSVEIPALRTVH
jgi:hypothetical protein